MLKVLLFKEKPKTSEEQDLLLINALLIGLQIALDKKITDKKTYEVFCDTLWTVTGQRPVLKQTYKKLTPEERVEHAKRANNKAIKAKNHSDRLYYHSKALSIMLN